MARPAPENPESPEARAKRLRAVRNALKWPDGAKRTQEQMAQLVGSQSGSALWRQYEAGTNRIDLDYALVLCRDFGFSLDWIYRGLWTSTIPWDLAENIRFEMRKIDETTDEPRRPSLVHPASKRPRGRTPKP